MSKIKTIVSAVVGATPPSVFDPIPDVTVTYDDGDTEKLFSFYPDEISFTEAEFIGKTRGEAIRLKQSKDKAFLQA